MIKIFIIADSFKHFQKPIEEYLKRMRNIKIIKIKPSKKGTRKQIIDKDTLNLSKYLKKDEYNVLLSLQGKELDTIKFTNEIISKSFNNGKKVNFFIGGAFGLNEDILSNINLKIRLSKLTFPHILVLVILIEQIYRSIQILNNKNYHY